MIQKKINIIFYLLVILIILFIFSCPKAQVEEDNDTNNRVNYLPFTFESSTPINMWLENGHVFAVGENGAVSTDATVDTVRAKTGAQSLKISGTLPSGSTIYTSCMAKINICETLNKSAQNFSTKIITASVYVPSAPVGGGDYIQFTLYNASNKFVTGVGLNPINYDAWNDVSFDVHQYVSGSETWGYDSTGGSPEDIYTAVTQVSIKVGFTNGPDRSYEYNIDDVNISDKSLTLRDLAEAQNMMIGAAVQPSQLEESDFSNVLKREFNLIAAENHMKFSYLEPTENNFTYTDADKLTDYAEDNNMDVRGHVLLWHHDHQVPQWVKDKNYSELQGVIENHVDNVMTHYKNKIHSWDVANEIVLDDGSGLRNRTLTGNDYSVWAANSTDESIIRAAFYKARSVATVNGDDVKLILCDYSNETMGQAKADKFYDIVNSWVTDGVPIDGVGFQLHLMEKYTPDYTNIRANIDRFQALGLDVQFTEIDIRIEEPVTAAKLNNQAVIYGELMQIARDKGLTTYVTWGVTDKYSWIPLYFSGYDAGLMFDEDYDKKPAYTAVQEKLY